MPTGNTTTNSLGDSLPTILDSARAKREKEGVFQRTTEKHTLPAGTGKKWEEIAVEQLAATTVTESTVLDNPQQFVDSLFSVEPSMIGIQTLITKLVQARIFKETYAKLGGLAMDAINRKKDQDYLTVLDGATTSLGGAGSTMTFGLIASAVARIRGNATERSVGPLFAVLHAYQIKDIQDEILAGIGTYTVPVGMTETTFKQGFAGTVAGASLFEDGNLTIDSSDDVKGGVHSREALLMVQGFSPRTFKRERPEIGGGSDEMFMYDEYAYGERSAGNWLVEIYTDATAPS